MTQKAAHYRNPSQPPARVSSLLRLLICRGLAFLCLLNILNTIISIPVFQQARFVAAIPHTQENDPDNSLLELALENCMDLPESASTPDTEDEPLPEEEYVFNTYSHYVRTYSIGKPMYMPVGHTTFIDPHLDNFTPPPKQA